jgi:hypothetical protein
MNNIQASKTRNKFISVLTRQGVRFKPPMPVVMLVEEDSLDSKIDLRLKKKFTLLLWDMEDMYDTSKGPRQYLGMINTIELDDFI